MGDKEFKLPTSSFAEIKKMMIAYAKSKSPSSLADINKLTGINKTIVSSNNGFLESISGIQGGKSKEATPVGKKLGLAFSNNIDAEITVNLQLLIETSPFIESMVTALGIKPRTSEDFQSHIAYSLGKEFKGSVATGTRTLIEVLKFADVIEEKEGILYPKKKIIKEDTKSSKNPDQVKVHIESNESNSSLVKQVVGSLGSNVTLNVNIQLTIPETENEKVYESFFEAMKKHLLS